MYEVKLHEAGVASNGIYVHTNFRENQQPYSKAEKRNTQNGTYSFLLHLYYK